MQEAAGQAILGTSNGAGCAYLVAQHKAQLGVKTITEVTLWAEEETKLVPVEGLKSKPKLSMYFTVKPKSAVGTREL